MHTSPELLDIFYQRALSLTKFLNKHGLWLLYLFGVVVVEFNLEQCVNSHALRRNNAYDVDL